MGERTSVPRTIVQQAKTLGNFSSSLRCYLALRSLLLAFVESSVISGIIPGHHEVLECFILNYHS